MSSSQTIRFTTSLGQFRIKMDAVRAPITANYFKRLAVEGKLDNTSIFRIVNSENNSLTPGCPIHVVQGGLPENDREPLPCIDHESTLMTGIIHKKWTVSAARIGPGETYGSFFITMRDEPSLDFGGKRHPDGQGFAAFGEVSSGYAVLEEIFQRAESKEYLFQKIPIVSAKMK